MKALKPKILITGGAGFIGSHVAEKYLKAGYPVVIVDDLSSGHMENIPKGAIFYSANIENRKKITQIFEKEKPSIVNHHAAQIDVSFSVENPLEDAKQNVFNTLSLFELSKKYGVKHWIYASSGGAIYGEFQKQANKETTVVKPMSPYGASKYSAEIYLKALAPLYSIPVVVLRYSNVYGPRQSPTGEAGVVSVFIRKMLEGKTPTIFGKGKQTRDYVYVEDVAEANLLALQTKKMLATYNIGAGLETSVLELYHQLQKILCFNKKPRLSPPKAGEIQRSVLNIEKVREELKWKPKTMLSEGLQKTILWHKSF